MASKQPAYAANFRVIRMKLAPKKRNILLSETSKGALAYLAEVDNIRTTWCRNSVTHCDDLSALAVFGAILPCVPRRP